MSLYAVKNDEGEWLELSDDGDPVWTGVYGSIATIKRAAQEWAKRCGGHLVELIEAPAKVVVSADEADKLERAKVYGNPADVILALAANHHPDDAEHILRAYVNGWTVENPKRWYVQTPKEWWEEPDIPEWMLLDTLRGVCSGFSKLSRTAFTRAELNQYHLDSDIFTLVPAEADKEVSR